MMARADKAGSVDTDDQDAVEERRLLQYPAEIMAGNINTG